MRILSWTVQLLIDGTSSHRLRRKDSGVRLEADVVTLLTGTLSRPIPSRVRVTGVSVARIFRGPSVPCRGTTTVVPCREKRSPRGSHRDSVYVVAVPLGEFFI